MSEDKSRENAVLEAENEMNDEDIVDISDDVQELDDSIVDAAEEAQEIDDSVVDLSEEAQELDDSVVDLSEEAQELDDSVVDLSEIAEEVQTEGEAAPSVLDDVKPVSELVDKSSETAAEPVEKCKTVDKSADSVDNSGKTSQDETFEALPNAARLELEEALEIADVKQATVVLGKSDVLGLVSDAFPAFVDPNASSREKLKYADVKIESSLDEDRIERDYVEDVAARSSSYMDCLADIDYRQNESSLDSMPRVVLSSNVALSSSRSVQTLSLDDETDELQKLTATEISVAHEHSRVASSDRIKAAQFVSGPEDRNVERVLDGDAMDGDEVVEKTIAMIPRYDIDASALGHTTVLPRNEVAGAEAARKASPSYAHQSMLQSLQELIAIERDSNAQVEAEVNQKSRVVKKEVSEHKKTTAENVKDAIEADLKASIEADLKAVIEPDHTLSMGSDLKEMVHVDTGVRAHARIHKPEAHQDSLSIAEIVAREWNEEDAGNEEHSVIADLNSIRPTHKTEDAGVIRGGLQLDQAPKARASLMQGESEKSSAKEDGVCNYEVISEIDRRGQSVTFQARNMDTNRVEMLKLFMPKGYALSQVANARRGMSPFKIVLIAFCILLFIGLVAAVLYLAGDMNVRKPIINSAPVPTVSAPPANGTTSGN